MRPTIFEAMEIGLLQIPFHPGEPFLFAAFWICFFVGILIQTILFLHCKSSGKWGFILFSLIGFLICEIGCQIITGWDLLAWLLFWFIFLTFLLGAGICVWIHFLRKR